MPHRLLNQAMDDACDAAPVAATDPSLETLVAAGVATHRLRLSARDGDIDTTTEAAILQALAGLSRGAILRLGPGDYAFVAGQLDAGAIETAFGDLSIPAPDMFLQPLTSSAEPPAPVVSLVNSLAGALRPDGAQRAVLDAAFAVRAAELAADGIAGIVRQAEQDRPDTAPTPEILQDQVTRLGDVLRRLEEVSSAAADLPADLRQAMAQAVRDTAPPRPVPDPVTERAGLSRLSLAMQAVLRRLDAQADALEERVGTLSPADVGGDDAPGDRLDRLASDAAARHAELCDRLSLLDRRLSDMERIRPPDMALERAGLQRCSLALQSMLRRLDTQCAALEAAALSLEERDGDPVAVAIAGLAREQADLRDAIRAAQESQATEPPRVTDALRQATDAALAEMLAALARDAGPPGGETTGD